MANDATKRKRKQAGLARSKKKRAKVEALQSEIAGRDAALNVLKERMRKMADAIRSVLKVDSLPGEVKTALQGSLEGLDV